ncbi:MAG TPA: hypothetical protein VHE30_11175 [Polyangiaceae bacterium]|nr:hypothetical protein [Polyangiaceae bacterium]
MKRIAAVTVMGALSASCSSSTRSRSVPHEDAGSDAARGGMSGSGSGGTAGKPGTGGQGGTVGAGGASGAGTGGALGGSGGTDAGSGGSDAGSVGPDAGSGGTDASLDSGAPQIDAGARDASTQMDASPSDASVGCVDGGAPTCALFDLADVNAIFDANQLTFQVTGTAGLPAIESASLEAVVCDCTTYGSYGDCSVVGPISLDVSGKTVSGSLFDAFQVYSSSWISQFRLRVQTVCGQQIEVDVANNGNYSLGFCTDQLAQPNCFDPSLL